MPLRLCLDKVETVLPCFPRRVSTPALSSHIFPQGVKRQCFKQFIGSRELPAFLDQFWGLGKRDQDSLVSCKALKATVAVTVRCFHFDHVL